MSNTFNTMPTEYQEKNLERGWHEIVSQRDLRVISKIRKAENKALRARTNQAMRNGNYDLLPKNSRNAAWLAW